MTLAKKLEYIMSLILSFGTIISIVLVTIGGSIHLIQHGHATLAYELTQPIIPYNPIQLFDAIKTLSDPLSLCELGLLLLVILQITRVGLLGLFYLYTKDYIFTIITTFVLCILIISFIWSY